MIYLITNNYNLYGYTDSKKMAKQFIEQVKGTDTYYRIEKDYHHDISHYRNKDQTKELVWFYGNVLTIEDSEDFFSTLSVLILNEVYDNAKRILDVFGCINPKFLNKEKLKPLLEVCSYLESNTSLGDSGNPILSYLLPEVNMTYAVNHYIRNYIADVPF